MEVVQENHQREAAMRLVRETGAEMKNKTPAYAVLTTFLNLIEKVGAM